jgi:hypothetical protein
MQPKECIRIGDDSYLAPIGSVWQGYGIHNAGRYITVIAIGKTNGKVKVERHIDGKRFWTFLGWYRRVEV